MPWKAAPIPCRGFMFFFRSLLSPGIFFAKAERLMKMEFKDVSENAISCIIDENDLAQWDITLEDLFSNGEKARVFIEEIVQRAQEEYDFVMDSMPLAVQISSIGNEQFVFTISKIGNGGTDFMDSSVLGKLLKDAVMRKFSQEKEAEKTKKKQGKEVKKKDKDKSRKEKKVYTLYFDNFSHAVDFCKRVSYVKGVDSSLYKDEEGKYIFIIKNIKASNGDAERILWISGEFAEKVDKKGLTAEYISEHYKIVIKKDAICLLCGM